MAYQVTPDAVVLKLERELLALIQNAVKTNEDSTTGERERERTLDLLGGTYRQITDVSRRQMNRVPQNIEYENNILLNPHLSTYLSSHLSPKSTRNHSLSLLQHTDNDMRNSRHDIARQEPSAFSIRMPDLPRRQEYEELLPEQDQEERSHSGGLYHKPCCGVKMPGVLWSLRALSWERGA